MSAIKIHLSQNIKIAFAGDLHFDNVTPTARLDNYMETCCRKLEAIGNICCQENILYLFFSGDVFNKISCTHECVNRLGNMLLSLRKKGIRLFSICGNHDLPRDSLNRLQQSPIETLFSFGVMEHVSISNPVEFYVTNRRDNSLSSVKITACDYTQTIPVADKNFNVNILLAHMFFNKSEFLFGDEQNITRNRMESLCYDMVFLGHDHEEHPPVMCGKTLVVRSGSLLRGTVHDYNFKREPGFVIVDDILHPQNVRKIAVPNRPYQDIISQTALNRKMENASRDTVDREAIRNLANKLVKARTKDDREEDIILKTIETDNQISFSCRRILLDYIQKAG